MSSRLHAAYQRTTAEKGDFLMRVGVVLGDFAPEAGGAYSFQEDVLLSLLDIAGESHHVFKIIGNLDRLSQPVRLELQSSGLETVQYSPPGPIERALLVARQEWHILRRVYRRPCKLDRVTRREGIDFLWFLSSATSPVDTPYVTIVWDLQHRLQPWFPEVSAQGTWDERERCFSASLQRAVTIIAGTKTGQREIELFYQIPSQRIKILPHPTPAFALHAPRVKNASVLAKYGLPEGYLFYPAQFWPHKNHANLLLALGELRRQYDLDLPLVLVGSDQGSQSHARQLANELGLCKKVFFLGFVPNSDLVDLYRNALALVYLTFFGPENLPPLEAFALGCPVIASKVAGVEEQLGDAALLVDPTDPGEIALAVHALCNDPALRATLIRRGMDRASRWTGHDFVRGMFDVLDSFEPIRRCWASY